MSVGIFGWAESDDRQSVDWSLTRGWRDWAGENRNPQAVLCAVAGKAAVNIRQSITAPNNIRTGVCLAGECSCPIEPTDRYVSNTQRVMVEPGVSAGLPRVISCPRVDLERDEEEKKKALSNFHNEWLEKRRAQRWD